MDTKYEKSLKRSFNLLLIAVGILITLVVALPFLLTGKLKLEDLIPKSAMEIAMETDYFNRNYDVLTLPNTSDENLAIQYGYELITNTAKYLGPNNGNADLIYTGNNLACTNCHLNAGTKAFAAPYIGVTQRYPRYRKREAKEATIQGRINGCMERSMNGKSLPLVGKEMNAMVAYMEWLGRDMPSEYSNDVFEGKGFVRFDIPDRAVNLEAGAVIYETKCASCHGANGEGQLNEDKNGSVYPALWGDGSYNHGAGMHRVLTAAYFIKANMPFGATAARPILSDDEAFDVAGYINSFDRPLKSNTEVDFPIRKLKSVSTPYPPYADSFPIEQHKYGPFPEMIEFYINEYGIKKTN